MPPSQTTPASTQKPPLMGSQTGLTPLKDLGAFDPSPLEFKKSLPDKRTSALLVLAFLSNLGTE